MQMSFPQRKKNEKNEFLWLVSYIRNDACIYIHIYIYIYNMCMHECRVDLYCRVQRWTDHYTKAEYSSKITYTN